MLNLNDYCTVICQCRMDLCTILKIRTEWIFIICYLKLFFYQKGSKTYFNKKHFFGVLIFFRLWVSQPKKVWYLQNFQEIFPYLKINKKTKQTNKQTNKQTTIYTFLIDNISAKPSPILKKLKTKLSGGILRWLKWKTKNNKQTNKQKQFLR